MIDHLGLDVSDYAKSRAFYDRALAPLGVRVVMQIPENPKGVRGAGYGEAQKPWFWVQQGGREPSRSVHVAFAADTRARVDAFHAAALEAGGRDNGAPGIRAHYHPDYYGAFVLDPDGNNIEAVCHRPEGKGA